MIVIDKVVAITGASSGIGEATALLLAGQGARMALCARRTDRLEALVERIKASGGDAIHASVDVRNPVDVANLVTAAQKHYGRLDVFVNNAGIGPISLLDELRTDDWNDMIDVNIKGVLHSIAAALPLFRAQKSGHFVNVASTAGLRIVPTMAVYAATKHAVRALSEGLRQEAGPDLRVTIITPGMTRTEFASSITSVQTRERIQQSMGDIAISPDAIARAIAFAIGQPADVDVGEIVVRPTAQA